MRNNKSSFLLRAIPAASLSVCAFAVTALWSASATAAVQDLGVAPGANAKTVTLALAVPDQAALDAFVASVSNPASPNYRKFLTPQQFAARFGQSPAAVARVRAYLESQGLAVTRVHADNLFVSLRGTNAQLSAVFGTAIHGYNADGVAYEAPVAQAVVPQPLAGLVSSVVGLSTRPVRKAHVVHVPANSAARAASTAVPPTPGAPATNTPGWYTTSDLANLYNVNPLYQHGLTGAGKTIGIATLAAYTQSDAYAYWAGQGLAVDASRITDVPVDGGPGKLDGPNSGGAGETTLDVEQSGGVAPGAKMRVYIAPNTNAGFLDLFADAINDNQVDVLSTSWGGPEAQDSARSLAPYHTVFQQAAAQGIPVISAAGDAGAYDINENPGSYVFPSCTTALTVDYPASDPYVLAAGGTTLPGTIHMKNGDVNVPAERPWGWDYLRDYVVKNDGLKAYYSGYFPVGGGGGVSVLYPAPDYQAGLPGVVASATGQRLICGPSASKSGQWTNVMELPGNYAGRNLPDLSLDADPYTGYSVYEHGRWLGGSGGTSFVAPQLNGILVLLSQGVNGRLGWVNEKLYAAFRTSGYAAGSPFRAIQSGDNLYYQATAQFNPASGLGSLDVEGLAKAFGAMQ